MADCVLVEKSEGVAILTMNRPAQLNAMSQQLSAELHDAVTRLSADDDVGCLVITGAGTKAFSAGGDIHEQREDDRRYTQAELDARNAVRARGSYEISACPKPTICMMNGPAYGGAAEPASSLRMRIGSERSSFRLPAAAWRSSGRTSDTTRSTSRGGPRPKPRSPNSSRAKAALNKRSTAITEGKGGTLLGFPHPKDGKGGNPPRVPPPKRWEGGNPPR